MSLDEMRVKLLVSRIMQFRCAGQNDALGSVKVCNCALTPRVLWCAVVRCVAVRQTVTADGHHCLAIDRVIDAKPKNILVLPLSREKTSSTCLPIAMVVPDELLYCGVVMWTLVTLWRKHGAADLCHLDCPTVDSRSLLWLVGPMSWVPNFWVCCVAVVLAYLPVVVCWLRGWW